MFAVVYEMKQKNKVIPFYFRFAVRWADEIPNASYNEIVSADKQQYTYSVWKNM